MREPIHVMFAVKHLRPAVNARDTSKLCMITRESSDVTFAKNNSIQEHLDSHIKVKHEYRQTFECEICLRSFGYKLVLDLHMKAMHENPQERQCRICYREFKKKAGLRFHIQSVHENKRDFQCLECNRAFHTKDHLRRHVVALHEKQRDTKILSNRVKPEL